MENILVLQVLLYGGFGLFYLEFLFKRRVSCVKRFFQWLLKYNNTKDISSLIVLIIALSFINLFDYQPIRNHPFLLIPFLIIVFIAMRILEEIFRRILRMRNITISTVYFYISIFLVITVTTVIKFFSIGAGS